MLLKIMQHYVPNFVKKKKLKEMFLFTADAFQSKLPELKGLSFDECLLKYALFTMEQAESYLQCGHSLEEVKHRLYQNSYIFGKRLRKSLHIKTWEDAARVLKIIYKLIGVDFHYNRQGEFIIKKCFYSQFYSKRDCMLISSMDAGIAAGLSGGGKLCFHQRMTEGSSCCKGIFSGG